MPIFEQISINTSYDNYVKSRWCKKGRGILMKLNVSLATRAVMVLSAAIGTVGFASYAYAGTNHRWNSQQAQAQVTSNGLTASNLQGVSNVNSSLLQNVQGSQNWGGYIDTPAQPGALYTNVTGKWTVPQISGTSNAVAAQWIGLGGVNSSDLLQIGTTEGIQNGQEVAQVFWEKLPATATDVMTVPVGSSISASIAQQSGTSTFHLTIQATDPNGQTQSKTIPITLSSAYAAGVGTSAEWISEDPSNQNNQLYPLANAGTVNFTGATVDGVPMTDASNQVQPTAMVDQFGNVDISPSSIGSDGESFSTMTTPASSQPYLPTGSNWGFGQMPMHHHHHHGYPYGDDGWGDNTWGFGPGSSVVIDPTSGSYVIQFTWG